MPKKKNNDVDPDQLSFFSTDLMKTVAEKAPQKRKILKDFSPEEAAEILEKSKKNKKAKKVNESEASGNEASENVGDPAAAELEKQQRDLIYRIKKAAKKLEVGNSNRVIVFPSYSEKSKKLAWYKMGDFSAQYYVYRMADRMGRSAKLRGDNDHFGRMKVIASVRDIEKFIKQVERLEEFDRHEVTEDGIHIFYLKKGLTDDEVALLRKTEELRKEAMHNVLRPKKAAPELFLEVMRLERQVVTRMNNMEAVYRDTVGVKMVEDATGVMDVYFDYTTGMLETEEVQKEMQRRINRVRSALLLLGDMDIISPAKACAAGETIVKVEKLIREMR